MPTELFQQSGSLAVQALVGRTGTVVPGVLFPLTTSAGKVWDDRGCTWKVYLKLNMGGREARDFLGR